MIFTSIEFVLFFLVFFAGWIFAKSTNQKIIMLAFFNVFFYGFYSFAALLYLFAWCLCLYCFGKKLKFVSVLFIIAFLNILFWRLIDAQMLNFNYAYPIGVSFFTFQGLTYIFALLKRPSDKPELHLSAPWAFLKIFAFSGFFLTIFSGPILRASHWEKNISQKTEISLISLNNSLIIILFGLIYKLIFSSYFYPYSQEAFSDPLNAPWDILFYGAYGYTMELFCDFAGYSLIAAGLGQMCGFNISRNFNSPYLSTNLKEFWTRWHITLSSWLRDYIYFYLGGARLGKNRQALNIAITMLVSSLWHGLGGAYLAWGAMHTIGVMAAHLNKFKINKYLSLVLTFHYLLLAWIFFKSKTFTDGLNYIINLFTFSNLLSFRLDLFFMILFFTSFFIQARQDKMIIFLQGKLSSLAKSYFSFILVWTFLFLMVLVVAPEGVSPFIYFSF